MFCTSCGNQIQDGVANCPVCGQVFVYGGMQQENQQYNQQFEQQGVQLYKESKVNNNDVKKIFSNANEEYVTSLGNTYLQSFLFNGSLSKGFCAVSDKRVYFNGTTYSISTSNSGKKRARRFKSSRIIDLSDVTGTGSENIINIVTLIFAYIVFVGMCILGAVPATLGVTMLATNGIEGLGFFLWIIPILIILGVVSMWIKALKTKTYVVIQYAGGEIAFDSKWYDKNEIENFQRELRIAKDKAQETKENAVANQLQSVFQSNNMMNFSAQSSKADELTKYADLFSKGLISEEEFMNFKQEVINSR